MKCKLPEREMTAEQRKRLDKRCIRENDKILHYADQLLCLSIRENLGFGRERIDRYNNGAYELGRWYIDRYTAESEAKEDYAVTSYYALAVELTNAGWDPEEHLWKDTVFASFPPERNSAQMRADHARRLVYAKGISFYVREMICITADYLHREFKCGAIRLDRVAKPVVEGYLDLMRCYMRCTKEGDVAMAEKIETVKKRYNNMKMFREDI